YLIYTSGSMGQPKGVCVAHSGLVNLTEDKIRVCEIREGDCVLQFFSFSFDGSVPEFVMTLAGGATLLMAPSTTLLPGPELQNLINRNRVTHITLTPSALAALPPDEYSALKMVLVGGEAPSEELIETWSAGRRFINAYGPTETTVNASMVVCGNGEPLTPTVRPSANKQLYVLDETLQLTPVGAVGELHIGGVGLTRGYHRQPALTAERFIPNPFPSESDRNYNVPVLYKTGDLAAYLPDGRIRILGRVDQQTKIRGFRIELGEIERVLEEHPDIKVGLVRVNESARGDKRLIAYGLHTITSHQSVSDVREYLAEKLPKFMLPSAFLWIDELPLTENGKLDESSLPEPEETAAVERIAPQTETETALAPMFSAALEVDDIGTGENFFDLGGHSLLATKLVSQVMETFDVEITVIDLFDAPTVAKLAQRIDQKRQINALMNTEIDESEEREEISL
ncbi:MAG: non-ribosomal peptide synthetase, partial [Verrucomicrobiota bacterium]